MQPSVRPSMAKAYFQTFCVAAPYITYYMYGCLRNYHCWYWGKGGGKSAPFTMCFRLGRDLQSLHDLVDSALWSNFCNNSLQVTSLPCYIYRYITCEHSKMAFKSGDKTWCEPSREQFVYPSTKVEGIIRIALGEDTCNK